MKKAIAKFIFKIFGWKATVELSEEMKHSVIVAAPHTSNWDFIVAILSFWIMEVEVKYFIKDNYTKSLFGWFFKMTGAIGVNRKKAKNNLTSYAVDLLNKQKELVIIVPAEGSRKWVEKWKTGFYRIATEAKVPICLGFVDYKEKKAGVHSIFYPSGDFRKDMTHIQEVYKNFSGRFPEQYNPKIF